MHYMSASGMTYLSCEAYTLERYAIMHEYSEGRLSYIDMFDALVRLAVRQDDIFTLGRLSAGVVAGKNNVCIQS